MAIFKSALSLALQPLTPCASFLMYLCTVHRQLPVRLLTFLMYAPVQLYCTIVLMVSKWNGIQKQGTKSDYCDDNIVRDKPFELRFAADNPGQFTPMGMSHAEVHLCRFQTLAGTAHWIWLATRLPLPLLMML